MHMVLVVQWMEVRYVSIGLFRPCFFAGLKNVIKKKKEGADRPSTSREEAGEVLGNKAAGYRIVLAGRSSPIWQVSKNLAE